MTREVTDKREKKCISRKILESLHEWFEIDDARERYILDSREQLFFAEENNDGSIGFICLKQTGKSTIELAVMGVLPKYHRLGIGRRLFENAHKKAKELGYEFIQVKTVAMGYYDDYDNTNRFYLGMGFKEFEVFPTLWGEENPCQIYIRTV